MRRVVLLAVFAVVALPASAATASSSEITYFEAPRELRAGDAQTWTDLQSLGVKDVRVLMYWHDVAPDADSKARPAFDETNPDAYPVANWAQYDRAIRGAQQRGIRVLVTISGPIPRWASAGHRSIFYKPSATRYAHFVTAVARRYGDAVDTWSIWNEPNHPDFLQPQFVHGKAYSPRLYRTLYRAGEKALAAVGERRVLMGETAPRGTPRVVSPIAFVRGALRGAHLHVSGWAHHPYTTKAGPSFRPPDADDVTIGVLSRLSRALNRAGYRHTPIYLTEFGVQSEPDPYVGVSERQQAEFRSIAERIAWHNPRVKAFSQYLMGDDAPKAGSAAARYSGFETGLRHSDGTPKLAFDGFRLPLVAKRSGSRVSLWGFVRPAGGHAGAEVQYLSGSTWKHLANVTTDARGYFTRRVPHRGSYRLVWNGSAGPATRAYR